MTTTDVVTVVVFLAFLPQAVFTIAYWKWIPAWINDPYGRLAQLGAWCHIVFLSVFESFILFGRHMNPDIAVWVLVVSFFPLIVQGVFQMILLRRAVLQARREEREVELEISDRLDPSQRS